VKKQQNYSSLKILIADDDEDDQNMLREAIENVRVDYALHNVDNGEKLMDYLAQCNGNTPDLIFLDLNMPRKNGLECLMEIRANQKFKDTAIAIYSTSSTKNDITRAFLAGANIYIRKPNDFVALQKIVAETLSVNWQYHTTRLKMENFVMVR
jgi:CheY-like chemotaxis protein